MTDGPLPFDVAGVRMGLVHNVTSLGGFCRGKLQVDENVRGVSAIQSVVLLARQVDKAPAGEYPTTWQAWRSECDKISGAGIWIGSAEQPVEEFSILD